MDSPLSGKEHSFCDGECLGYASCIGALEPYTWRYNDRGRTFLNRNYTFTLRNVHFFKSRGVT
ncbi:hypothetical protein CDQ84_09245 [Clostridium thermosuccinogenes]|uniref:Uncharacterized protein n=1 Tax=Clostridium thermosuccinogenes TaxID=84032 RepID=A0A2K2FKF3_9CLOT|nr:hypothetical protein [Pseudoclostridium thermosuccinogenes]PNT97289.1 hypothetical protein CDQ85_09095 [Pseudoclostridium thermosuccinogenes]PNT99266.1 hypothetical protein CDQ84_09245 [Pseudoclostridium thermosuccinogenes]